jgi:hypothetical protein
MLQNIINLILFFQLSIKMGNVNLNVTNNINNTVMNSTTEVIQSTQTNTIQTQKIKGSCSDAVKIAAIQATADCKKNATGKMSPDDIVKVCTNYCEISDVSQTQFLNLSVLTKISGDIKTDLTNKINNDLTNKINDKGGFSILGLNKGVVDNVTNEAINILSTVSQIDIKDIKQEQTITLDGVSMHRVTQDIGGKFILKTLQSSTVYNTAVQEIANKITQNIKSTRNMTIGIILGSIVLLVLLYVLYKWKKGNKGSPKGRSKSSHLEQGTEMTSGSSGESDEL